MKKLTLILLSIIMIVTLAACGNKCKNHVYDNDCDATCNHCGETREAGAHDYANASCTNPKTCTICGATEGEALGHDWKDADCITPKTCQTCAATEGEAHGHTPEEDDGNCMTEIYCSVCGEVTTRGKTEHIWHADDGDCTTAVICTACPTVRIEAVDAHDFEGPWHSDAEGHWHVCMNISGNCTVTDTKTAHTKGADGECTKCGYVIEVIQPHEHSYSIADYNETHHYMRCACGTIDESTKATHDDVDDHNCTTEDKCSCGYVVSEAKDHVAGEDDGNCTTAIKCQNCDQVAEAGNTNHADTDHDWLCDNNGCQITLDGAPTDDNEGIDLPIDTN